ncbi:small GTP-binding protein [Mucor ambiguus]|uniref:Small GTP-binding protein n=1 Tax=Mucor ambiguus TaxID=91626 RepID=A0A0C9N7E3_9FUNG|nr:small GTP-binding protein [Mucor ambiguus]
MALTYLEGGKTLDGVSALPSSDMISHESGFSYSSESSYSTCSSMDDQSQQHQQNQLIVRRLGLSSEDFAHRLLTFRNDHPYYMTTLDASRNQISTIHPSLLSCFTHLTQLNLSCNHLSVIPEAILGLDQLQQLYLSENQIEAMPEAMPLCLAELTVLNLDSNRMSVLPDSIGHWKKLREFRLGSEYGGNMIEELPASVSDMLALVELDLSFNDLQHVGTLQGLQRLRYLNLSHNRIKHLPMLAEDCSQLNTLDVSDNLIRAIPHAMANSVLRLMRHGQLQVLNLSNNRLELIPTEILDQTQTQVIIQGNPLTLSSLQHQYLILDDMEEEEEGAEGRITVRHNDTHTVRNLIQAAIPMMDYHLHQNDQQETLSLEEGQEPGSHHDPIEQDIGTHQDQGHPIYLVHSLREITLRLVALKGDQLLSDVPEHLLEDIRENLQLCPHCRSPFIHEWVSTAQLRTYQSHRSVPRQVRFCGTACWLAYKDMLQQQALAAQSEVHITHQRQDALAFIAQHGHVLEPGSFEWVMAASLAATAQEEQADLLANAMMMM